MFVELLTKVRTGLLCVDETDMDTLLDESGNHFQKWLVTKIQILDIGRANPKRTLDRLHFSQHLLPVLLVLDVFGDGIITNILILDN